MLDQAPLILLDTEIKTISSQLPGNPFGGTKGEVSEKQMTIYWKGDVPDSVLAAAQKTIDLGYTIDVQPALHSEAELMSVAAVLAATAGKPNGLIVRLENDGSGFIVMYPGLDGNSNYGASEAVLAAIETVLNLGVAVRQEKAPEGGGAFLSRAADSSPYWGGARILMPKAPGTVVVCSSGFGMNAGYPYQYMITAAHCADYLDNATINNGAGSYMGYTDYIHELHDLNLYDLGLIRLPAGAVSTKYIYADTPSPPSFASRTVVGVTSGFLLGIRANYCTSGQVSGMKCNIYVNHQDLHCVDGHCLYAVHFDDGYTSQPAACSGDSGGPIYMHPFGLSDPSIYATGIISIGAGYKDSSNCYSEGWAPSVIVALSLIPGLNLTL